MAGFDRDDVIEILGKMFLASGKDEKPNVDQIKGMLPDNTPTNLANVLVRTLESSIMMDVDWRSTNWDEAKDIASRISKDSDMDPNVVLEAVSMIEEASKIEFADDMPWLGYAHIDPCCGNYCLMAGHSGLADTPETLVIPRFIAFKDGDDVEFDWVEDVSSFEDCSFKTLVIPKSVMYISLEFSGCGSFERIIVDERNPRYSSDEQGLLYSKHKSVLCYCPNAKTSITIPKSVVKIDEDFLTKDSKLKEIKVEEGNTVFHVDQNGILCDKDGPVIFDCYDE